MLVLVLLYYASVCQGHHVLVVFSVPERSHSVLANSVVDTLLASDYEVTYVSPYPKDTRPNLKYVDVSSVLDQIEDEKESDLPEDIYSPRYLTLMGTSFAQQVLRHSSMRELMVNSSIEFDAVLVEWFYTGLFAPLAALFECPLIWYAPTGISSQSLSLVGHTPKLDDPSNSLAHRIHHMWFQIYFSVWNYLHISKIEIPAYEDYYGSAFKTRFRFLPTYEFAAANGSLLLLNSHPLLGAVVPLPGNVKFIGGHHIAEDVSPLPKDLKKVLDSSAGGAIYVNMESNLISMDIQDQITRELKEVFSDLEQTVIWKYGDILVNLPHNVYTLKNPPQHSILSHVNTIAFINHGDMNSILDATHFGVPMITLPLLKDQADNVNIVVKRGCGVKMINKDLISEVKKSVEAVLNNNSYQINAKQLSSIFHHRLAPQQTEFIYLVEAVIRTNGAAHLRSSIPETPIIERYNVDIMSLILMIFWFLTKVAKVVKVHTSREDHEKED
ncbi:jg23692 [Pararge aegeria aegeria]|uniref:Jg23692 protein n=1 Tax=Pararge aegeria aegeria TaxID=348720 RepID=A0A8S4QV67_9NEOP|nr:jg23692 [Pararge aegeria aegeria]